MALHNEIPNSQLQVCIDAIPSSHFTTFRVIAELENRFPAEVASLKAYSERNWRSVIGKAIKRYSVETNRIEQVSPSTESPARWEKK